MLLELDVATHHAAKRSPSPKETHGVIRAKNVEFLPFRCLMFAEQEEVFEQGVLPDCLRTSLPVYELELGNTTVGLKIERAPGISCAKRYELDRLIWLHDLWQNEQCRNRMDEYVDLPCRALHRKRCAQEIGCCAEFNALRLARGTTALLYGSFEIGDTARQAGTTK